MKSDYLLVFDCFGVIVSEIAPFWLRRYFSDEQADAVKADIVSKADIGLISEAEMFRRLGECVGCSPEQAKQDWLDMVILNPGMPEVIRQLKQHAEVVLLSDSPAGFLRDLLEQQHLTSLFSELYISSERKLKKPNPEFFKLVLREGGIPGERVLMIDDNEKNIIGAREAGMQGLHFTFQTADEFKAALTEQFPSFCGR